MAYTLPYKAFTKKLQPCIYKGQFKLVRSVLAYTGKWNYDSLTEHHALSQAIKLLPEEQEILYFGFPWSILIELLESDQTEIESFTAFFNRVKKLIIKRKFIVTVCQHINLLKYTYLFSEIGVTHLFWTHSGEKNDFPFTYKGINIFPFPFAPTHKNDNVLSMFESKKYVYAFIDKRAKNFDALKYCKSFFNQSTTDQGAHVVDFLQQSCGNFLNNTKHERAVTPQGHTYDLNSIESLKMLKESFFSLCFQHNGSNSILLWESIGCGAIPVIFREMQPLPGKTALWEEALVSISKKVEDIWALPDQLEALSHNDTLLERKRHALRQLWMLYGPDIFIYDILKLFLSLAQTKSYTFDSRPGLSFGKLLTMAATINQRKLYDKSEGDLFILECSSLVASDPDRFLYCYKGNTEFRSAYKQAVSSCNLRHSEAMRRNLKFKGIALNSVGR